MQKPDVRLKQLDQLKRQGYFELSPDQRARLQQGSIRGLKLLKDEIQKSAERYAREVRKDEQ